MNAIESTNLYTELPMLLRRAALIAGLLLVSVSIQADQLGTVSARSANPANSAPMSVEASLSLGGDLSNFGLRLNYQVSDALTVYGDLSLADRAFNDGAAFGAGLFYYLPNLGQDLGLDTAIQASFHTLSGDVTTLDGHLLISPIAPLNEETGLSWYASVGLARQSYDFGFVSVSDIDIALGGGVYLPMGPGTVYAGTELNDVFGVTVGYRYDLN